MIPGEGANEAMAVDAGGAAWRDWRHVAMWRRLQPPAAPRPASAYRPVNFAARLSLNAWRPAAKSAVSPSAD
jgi:hypothetical protein